MRYYNYGLMYQSPFLSVSVYRGILAVDFKYSFFLKASIFVWHGSLLNF